MNNARCNGVTRSSLDKKIAVEEHSPKLNQTLAKMDRSLMSVDQVEDMEHQYPFRTSLQVD